jgi:ABC-type branched-subunit amino acid transport system permease subunit
MVLKTLVIAALMIAVGVYGYTSQDPDKGPVSPTAAMPAVLGVIFAICAVIGFSASRRKHAMHAVAVLSLLGAIGSLYPVIKTLVKGNELVLNTPKTLTSLASSLLCLILLVFCVRSFIAARRARRALSANPF